MRHGRPCTETLLLDERHVPRDIILSVLQIFSETKDLGAARRAHSLVVGIGLDSVALICNYLIRLYASFGSLPEANQAFDKTLKPSVYTWNAIISAHTNLGGGPRALKLFYKMEEAGITPNRVTYLSILKSCSHTRGMQQGRSIHDQINASKYRSDLVVKNTIIDMYVKCGSLSEAREIFDDLLDHDVVTWGVMIAGYSQNGHGMAALELYVQMQQQDVKPDRVIYASALRACGIVGVLANGRLIHQHILTSDQKIESDLVVGNALVDMYGKCGSLEEAQAVFENLSSRDVVSWDAMITSYVNHGHAISAIELFKKMCLKGQPPVKATYLCILRACGTLGDLEKGKDLHNDIVKNALELDLEIGNTLVDMYAKCQSLNEAQKVFDDLAKPDVVSWSAIMSGYLTHGHYPCVLELFDGMNKQGIKPNELIVSFVLKACGGAGALEQGKMIHKKLIRRELESDLVVQNSLIDMYVKCGDLQEARKAFDKLTQRDVVSWGAMISAYAQHGHDHCALELYDKMQQEPVRPNNVVFSLVLKACGNLRARLKGQVVHDQVLRCTDIVDQVVYNTLIDMYAKCGSLSEACKVFDNIQNKDVISWATMIAGHVEQGYGCSALHVYETMLQEGLKPSKVIFLYLLKACMFMGAIKQCRFVHNHVLEAELDFEVAIGNSLVDVYAKCGSIEEARSVFDHVCDRDAVSWASMIAGYAAHGDFKQAGQCLEDMRHQGVQPDDVMFSSILSACSYSGSLQEGQKYFNCMREEFGLKPSIEHYSCMIDLLARAGCLTEARDLVHTMPNSPDLVVWRSLLAGCKFHRNVELARQSFDGVLQLDSVNASAYVLMSTVYKDLQMWEDSLRTEELKINAGSYKKAGKSWIEAGDKVHEFTVGDESKLVPDGMFCAKFQRLSRQVKTEGYMPQVDAPLVGNHNGERMKINQTSESCIGNATFNQALPFYTNTSHILENRFVRQND